MSIGKSRNVIRFIEGPRIRELRESLGLKQRHVTARGGISQPNLSRIEAGLQNPDLGTLRLIAKGLGMPAVELVLFLLGHQQGTEAVAELVSKPLSPESRQRRERLVTECAEQIQRIAKMGRWDLLAGIFDVVSKLADGPTHERRELAAAKLGRNTVEPE